MARHASKVVAPKAKPAYNWTTMSRKEKIALGRSLRKEVNRIGHGGWVTPKNRRDPIDILIESSKGRLENLIPIRYGRMMQSPFAFYRGTASIMASDLATTSSTGIYVQACGDCHLLNFGSYSTPERRIIFDINDFDETLEAPWEWDIKRLAASFIIAALHNNFSKEDAMECVTECVLSYSRHIKEYSEMDPLKIWYAYISSDDILRLAKNEEASKRYRKQIEKAAGKSAIDADFPKLATMKNGKAVIKDAPPLIFHYDNIDLKADRKLLDDAFNQYLLSLGAEKKRLLENYEFHDLAAKVVGVGSVGTRCGITLRMTPDNEPLFLQVKEARASVLEPYVGKNKYKNQGERVVVGQKMMQAATDIFLGWTELNNGGHFYIRQLRDMKIKPLVEIFDAEQMKGYARLCGWTLARAHARSGCSAVISGYLGSGEKFADAITNFAVDYAIQNDKDYEALKDAVRKLRIEVFIEA